MGHRPQVAFVDLSFFDAFDASILAGRGFGAADIRSESMAAVVNASFVSEILGGGSAIGLRVRYRNGEEPTDPRPSDAAPGPWFEIVGVVSDLALVMDPDLSNRRAGMYHARAIGDVMPARMAVRVREDPVDFAPRLRSLAASVDPALRLSSVRPLDDIVETEAQFYEFWFRFTLVVSFVVLLLALSGIYAVVSFTTSRRTREVGIRVALGADRRQIVLALLSRSLLQVGSGVAAGTALLLALAFLVTETPGTVEPWLVGFIAGDALLIMCVSLLACGVPIRRALNVEPTEALRADG